MPGVKVALAIGLTLIAITLAVLLAHAPATLARTNGVTPEGTVATIRGRTSICQTGEVLPRGTSAVVAWLEASIGPRVTVALSAGGHVLATGERTSGWTGASVTIALAPMARTIAGVTACFRFAAINETVTVRGLASNAVASATSNGRRLGGQMRLEYLRPGRRSWWSMASAIAGHMGLGRVPSGRWAVIVACALAATIVALASGVLLRELR
jgi:hypothetical protein